MTEPLRYTVATALLAGSYPGSAEAVHRLEREGVTLLVDLTHPSDPLEPYARHLGSAQRISHPISDMSTPTLGRMITILDDIDAARDRGDAVYVHCWGGVGRTGTVIGCWLVRHGLDEGDAVARIATLRRDLPWTRLSPETAEQAALVRSWRPRR